MPPSSAFWFLHPASPVDHHAPALPLTEAVALAAVLPLGLALSEPPERSAHVLAHANLLASSLRKVWRLVANWEADSSAWYSCGLAP